MLQNIVARYQDGSVLKGTSTDFFPNRDQFHLHLESGDQQVVLIKDLKAVFFVLSFDGDPDDRGREDVERTGLGRKIRVDFKDGETMHGYTSGYSPDRNAFFVFPADPASNNERVFVITAATSQVVFV
ncbi:MAG: hypothetical protein OEO77_04725 [Acidimicrobiia bacterium]|nr:hypothetical protein [Acidimicrobiia bacterium]